MMLGVKDVARLLCVSEKTIYRWISKNDIPVYKLNEIYRFNKLELMEWATSKKLNVSYEIFDYNNNEPVNRISISDLVSAGGIYYHVSGKTKENVLRSIVNLMNIPDDIDRDYLFNSLMARENLGSTAIGEGVAIPHVRNPIVLHINRPVVSICFLDEPMDFNALDGKPVDTVFTILSNSIKVHLSILSKISFILHQENI
ncbi:MAG: PTS sugar transporter subunit IIA [Deltaproteobacteria bacterium]|nr:PTS sugar transporter subunit IIA [Deltaproteobacteria bacterium]